MGTYRQIRLVLWKNFTIRRRRWPRAIFEFIWPLFLFLILMWVRTRNLTSYNDACHNDPKYLGSTGFLPALQSYICRYNNTCYSQSKTTDEFNDETSFWNIIINLSESLSIILKDDEIFSNLSELFSQVNSLISLTNVWNGSICANESMNDFNQTIPTVIITDLFANPISLSNLHQFWFMNKTQNSLSNLEVASEIYYVSRQRNFSYSYQSEIDIQQSFCINGEFNRTFSVNQIQINETINFLCSNLSAIDLKSFLISVQEQLDQIFLIDMTSIMESFVVGGSKIVNTTQKLRNRLEILNVNFPFEEYYSNISLNTICGGRNDLSQYSNQNQSAKTTNKQTQNDQTRTTTDESLFGIDWNNLAIDLLSFDESEMCEQSYITGSGSTTQTITVSRSCRCILFDDVLYSNPILKQFLTIVRPILYGKIYYHPSNIHYDNIIKQINHTFESLDEFVRLFRQMRLIIQPTYNIFHIICNIFFDNPSFICEQLPKYKTSINFLTILTEFIACSELNRFIAMNTELDMIREGQDKSQTNNFLASIKFMNDITNNDSLPKHIQFKIRMTLDQVDNTFQTEDRYFSYTPRARAPSSTKYHTYAFIYLQNAIERAIIYLHTGKNVAYGIQTQQMPYPCWINDKFVNSINRMLPLIMVLSWIFTVSMNVKDIVCEKEKRLKEIMKIMGLQDSVHWFTWFILCTTIMILTAFILVLLLKLSANIN
ncbi:unnamed protein product [Rotaria sordida]|uniref:ABC-2 type transporter transmembrane domain-containing protein n=1 Tax=Rotaria sordida TaxID=392033 RepID=A0A813UMQ0_9BILA|nr:unnamed protein product [Rotaria sordida]CAF0953788.1 unnamed protein product [Rotaria sordida]